MAGNRDQDHYMEVLNLRPESGLNTISDDVSEDKLI